MVIERVLKVDSSTSRVQEAQDDRGRRGQEQAEEDETKEKDKFDKGRPFWKKLVPDFGGRQTESVRARMQGKRPSLTLGVPDEASDSGSTGSLEEEEPSFTMSQRPLVLWGIMDMTGRPRPKVIATYVVVAALIILSVFMILGILWR